MGDFFIDVHKYYMGPSNIKIGVLHQHCSYNIHKFLRLNNHNVIVGYENSDLMSSWHERDNIKGKVYSPQGGEGIIKLKDFQEVIHRVCNESDIVLSWGAYSHPEILKEYAHKPLILSANGQCAWTRKYIQKLEPFHNHFIAVSEMAKLTFSPEVRHLVNIVPNQINTEIYKPLSKIKCRQKLNLPLDEIIIGTFGRPAKDKRYDLFMSVMNNLPDYKSMIVGGFEKDNANFHFPFHHGTMELFYNSIDCFVSLSEREGDSNCIKEAMACKVPCVTTPVGSAIEMATKHNCPNIIVPFHFSSDLIARAIRYQVSKSDVELACEIIRDNYSDKDKLLNYISYLYQKWCKRCLKYL